MIAQRDERLFSCSLLVAQDHFHTLHLGIAVGGTPIAVLVVEIQIAVRNFPRIRRSE
ncbi:MAG: hypothetical protein IT427_15170 [Pirellulales bacterium]|nr:hypothetical protein [Pirellulales bacterium]